MKYFIAFSKNLPKNLKPSQYALWLNLFAVVYDSYSIFFSPHWTAIDFIALTFSLGMSIGLYVFIMKMYVDFLWGALKGK